MNANTNAKPTPPGLGVPPNVVVQASKPGKSSVEEHGIFLNEVLCPLVGRKFLLFLIVGKFKLI